MKILLYTSDIQKVGGIETSFFELAKFLKSNNYDVGVRFNVINPMQLERYKEAGIDVRHEVPELCDILIIGSIWRRPKMIKAKVTVQGVHADWTDKFWNGAASAINMISNANKEVDIFACVSKSSAEFVKRIATKPIIVMHNLAPEKTAIKRTKSDVVRFGAFTRMTAEKGLKNYQEFRERVKSLGIKAEFNVWTPGEAPTGWEKHEPIPDIRTALKDIDMVVSLADTESFGYTIAEANSCGVPCVIKRTNSTSEFFSDKDNLILDTMSNFSEKDLHRTIKGYQLRVETEKSVLEAIKSFEKLASQKCIIKVTRQFKDIQANKNRPMGEIFSVNIKRAKELLSNKNNIVEEL